MCTLEEKQGFSAVDSGLPLIKRLEVPTASRVVFFLEKVLRTVTRNHQQFARDTQERQP